jgi:hypothetical protein
MPIVPSRNQTIRILVFGKYIFVEEDTSIDPNTPESGRTTLSQLFILKEIMDRIQYDLGRREPLLPCDFFDMISGSGFGGYGHFLTTSCDY